jgi:hypothetical protein
MYCTSVVAQACSPTYSREGDKDHGWRPPLAKTPIDSTLTNGWE